LGVSACLSFAFCDFFGIKKTSCRVYCLVSRLRVTLKPLGAACATPTVLRRAPSGAQSQKRPRNDGERLELPTVSAAFVKTNRVAPQAVIA